MLYRELAKNGRLLAKRYAAFWDDTMTRYWTIIFMLFFCSCSNIDDHEIYYVIKQPDPRPLVVRKFNDTSAENMKLPPPAPPAPRSLFYGHHNFVLLADKIFYHDNNLFRRCGTGVDFSKPPRLNLCTYSISEIQLTDLNDFLDHNVPDSILSDELRTVCIASTTDTIRNKAFVQIRDHLESKNIRSYFIRTWTEEEQYAIEAILQNKTYDPKTVVFKRGFDLREN